MDNTGITPHGNATITNALFDAYDPTQGGLNLTTTTFSTDCFAPECTAAGLGFFLNTGFYPARYYTWTDTNADTVVDATDAHQLIEIRSVGCTAGASCPATFTHSAFNSGTESGRTDCGTDNGDGTVTCSYAEEIQNFANWFQYYRKRDLTAKAALSHAIEDTTTARVGYATLNRATIDNIRSATMNADPESGNKKSLLDKIYTTTPNGSTPLRDKLEETGFYFECKGNDIFNSASVTLPGDQDCALVGGLQGTCQANYALITTDGSYTGTPPSIASADDDNNSKFDQGAFASNVNNTLADVAMDFYERDLHSTLADNVPTTTLDVNRFPEKLGSTLDSQDTLHQHMATYAVTFGINGTLSAMPADPKVAFAWPNPITGGSAEKIDDLRHAAYNGRGEYISVNHPGDSLADTITLSQAMDGIFEELGSAEGAASSVAFNSQTIEADSVVFRAFFNTIDDTGSLVAQKINPDGTLNEDASGDPIFEWDAADRLDLATSSSSDSRAIITYDDNGASSAGVAFQWSSGGSPITAGQQALLETPPPNLVANAPIGDDRLDYLRGHFVNEGSSAASDEFRIRPSTEGKMGDVVHSTPVYVGEPEFTGRNTGQYPGVISAVTNDLYSKFRADNSSRNAIVYVGANDGMMHGFDSDTGDEIFGYVPNVVIENLPDLTDPNYSHRYYVDLTPALTISLWLKMAPSALPGIPYW